MPSRLCNAFPLPLHETSRIFELNSVRLREDGAHFAFRLPSRQSQIEPLERLEKILFITFFWEIKILEERLKSELYIARDMEISISK